MCPYHLNKLIGDISLCICLLPLTIKSRDTKSWGLKEGHCIVVGGIIAYDNLTQSIDRKGACDTNYAPNHSKYLS